MITFDFGDTLVSSDPPYLARIWMALKDLGIERTRQEVERAYHLADWKVSEKLLKEGNFVPEYYQREIGITLLKQLEIEGDYRQLLSELAEWLVGFRPERVLMPGALELVKTLKEKGYTLGIISNNDGRTREKCRAVGIEEFFDFILDSTLEGMVKPDPRFFQKALRLGKAQPDQSLHIGDLWGSDILGARATGIPAVWLRNSYLSPEEMEKVVWVNNLEKVLELVE